MYISTVFFIRSTSTNSSFLSLSIAERTAWVMLLRRGWNTTVLKILKPWSVKGVSELISM
jgi:hypothetical protein